MEAEQRSFIEWLKVHKTELILAGVGIPLIILLILGIKNQDQLLALWKSLKNKISEVPKYSTMTQTIKKPSLVEATPPRLVIHATHSYKGAKIPQGVGSHLRNLPKGQRASAYKLATASENGFLLHPGQTWVKDYTKNTISA